MKYLGITLFLLVTSPVLADTLYQANVSGYPTNIGVGIGVGSGYYTNSYNNGYTSYSSATTSGVPYDNFTYPYSSGCCGCNVCNNCGTNYSIRGY